MSATQRDRVLAAAKRYNGVCATDFLLPDVIDGGPPITRLAARLYELDAAGHSFECLGRRDKCKIWRLVGVESGSGLRGANTRQSDPADPVPGATPALNVEPDDLRLFEPPVPSALKEAA